MDDEHLHGYVFFDFSDFPGARRMIRRDDWPHRAWYWLRDLTERVWLRLHGRRRQTLTVTDARLTLYSSDRPIGDRPHLHIAYTPPDDPPA